MKFNKTRVKTIARWMKNEQNDHKTKVWLGQLPQTRVEWRIPIISHTNTDDHLSIIPVPVSAHRD
jgi:hypothetical protein